MKTSLLTLVATGFVTLSTGCSMIKPILARDDQSGFVPYDWNGHKQPFLKESQSRGSGIATELKKLAQRSPASESVDEAKYLVAEAQVELGKMKYANAREWHRDHGDFLATLSALEEKYKVARKI